MSGSTTVSASVRLRPTRIGFLVRLDDMAAVRQAMQVCTCLWGGIYNPIIPVCTTLPEAWRDPPCRDVTGIQLARGYIKFFEPDVFVETQDGLANEIGLSDAELEYGEPRAIPISVFSDPNPDRVPQPFGTNILHVYRSLYEREFRFVSRDGDRVAAVSTAGADGRLLRLWLAVSRRTGGWSRCKRPMLTRSSRLRFPPMLLGSLRSSRMAIVFLSISPGKDSSATMGVSAAMNRRCLSPIPTARLI